MPVVVYETQGHVIGSRRAFQEEDYVREMKAVFSTGQIQLVLCCVSLQSAVLSESLIRTFELHNRIGVDWRKTVVTLTFADKSPRHPNTSRLLTARNNSEQGFQCSGPAIERDITCSRQDFQEAASSRHHQLRDALIERVGLRRHEAESIVILSTVANIRQYLPDGRPWYKPLWECIFHVLTPEARRNFLQIHRHTLVHDQINRHFDFAGALVGERVGSEVGATMGSTAGPLGGIVGGVAGGFVGGAVGGVVGRVVDASVRWWYNM